MATIHGSLLSLVVGSLLLLFAGNAGAQEPSWIGRWGAPNCDGGASQIELDRSFLDLSPFETMCKVRNVRQRGPVFEIRASCMSEGHANSAVFTVRVTGDALRFEKQQGFEFDPKQFRRCTPSGAKASKPTGFAHDCIRCMNEAHQLGRGIGGFCPGTCSAVYETMVCDGRGMNCRPGASKPVSTNR